MRPQWLAALVLVGLPLAAVAQEAPKEAQVETAPAAPAKVITLSGDRPELGGDSAEMAFVAGGQPRVTAKVVDDIFAAGGELRIDGAEADHLFAGGGSIDLSPGAVRDVVAVGGRIDMNSGVISDDLVVMGGEIHARPESRIEGSAVMTGGRLRIRSPVARELIAAGGMVEVDSAIGGDARITGGDIVIGPSARVGGDLYVRGERVEISPQAVISGRTIRQAIPHRERDGGKAEKVAAAAFLGSLFMLGILVVHGAIAIAAPGVMAGAERRIRGQTLSTAGVGALIVLLAPMALVALLASVIGAPLAMFLAVAFVAIVPVAFAGVSYTIGQALRGRLARSRASTSPGWGARLGWTLLGAVLMTIVFLLPLLGAVAWLIALIVGIGAAVSQLLRGGTAPAPA